MTAGTGSSLYTAPPEKVRPPRLAYPEYMISMMRSPMVELPSDQLLKDLIVIGALSTNEARRVAETWHENHALPGWYVPPEMATTAAQFDGVSRW